MQCSYAVMVLEIIILMGQHSSDLLDIKQMAHNWLPQQRDANLFAHKGTRELIRRNFIKILIKDLPRETALFSARMTNHQQYICRLHYFHLAATEVRGSYDHQRDFREMWIYTDELQKVRDWSREKVVAMVQGLRKLVSVHGPIRITQSMLGQSESGEIRVWISENSVNNHPDSKYMSEEQSVADLASILTRNNKDLAAILIGCNTLKEAAQKLVRRNQQHSPHQGYSHRASGSGDISKKKLQFKEKQNTPYKNVFGEGNQSVKMRYEGPITPKNSLKAFQNYPQSSFLPREEDPGSLNKYRDFLYPPRSNIPMDEKMPNKSNPKTTPSIAESSLQFRKKDYPQAKSNYRLNKGSESQVDIRKFNNDQGSQRTTSKAEPFVFQHRFQTASNFTPSNNSFFSSKPIEWSNKESVHFYPQEDPRKAKPAQRAKGCDITIINNNVNNFISNITHNHIAATSQSQHQFRNSKFGDPKSTVHSSNQFSKNTKERGNNIPVFIQQKKKISAQWPSQMPPNLVTKSKSNINLTRKNTASSNPQQPTLQSPQYGSQTFIEEDEKNKNRVLNFSRNNQQQKNLSFYPLTPTYLPSSQQTFSSFQKGFNSSFQLKSPLRTKTTQFFQKGGKQVNKGQLQNKSFTQTELQKSAYDIKTEAKDQTPIREEKIEQNEDPQNPPSSNKQQLKKKLRNQFKFLLGGDAKEEPQQPKQNPIPSLKLTQEQPKQVSEGSLKQKLMRKQKQFAELKKQTSKLLD